MLKKPHYLIQCYDVYLDTAQTPVMKRTDFIEIIRDMYPDYTHASGRVDEGALGGVRA